MPPLPLRKTERGWTKDPSSAAGATMPEATATLWSRKKLYTPTPQPECVVTLSATR